MKLFVLFASISIATFIVINPEKNSGSDTSIEGFIKSIDLDKASAYVILRGSDTKLGGFAKQYNNSNIPATHIGLLISTNDSLTVYHVNTEKNSKQSHLIVESLKDFSFSEEESYLYLSLWKIKGFTTSEILKMKNQIRKFDSLHIMFDYKFNFEDDKKMYCSEFVYKTLTSIDSLKFFIPKSRKKVFESHRFFLKKDSLEFYPVDYFIPLQDIELIAEWRHQK